ncbi:MAG TPA: hypothetical protein VFX59_31140 [Polyangiales bacterium]|nr:hypothetical protein [Polyangiales bacterium]
MFSRLRFFALAVWLGTSLVAWAQDAPPPSPAPSDQVYRVQRHGREVFTNAGSVQVGGAAVDALVLPQLNADLERVSPSELQLLDNSVQRVHDDLQQGTRCQAIRASLRVPLRVFVLRAHLRELLVGGGLLALAVVIMVAWQGRLRSLMPVAPLLGCLYLGYATYARVDARLGALRDGLHACSSDLPPQGGGVQHLRDRLQQASSLQSTIDRAYALRTSAAEAAMRER